MNTAHESPTPSNHPRAARRFAWGTVAIAGLTASASLVPPAVVTPPNSLAGAYDPDKLDRLLQAERLSDLQEGLYNYSIPEAPPEPWPQAEIFFEENATDGDLGIHTAIDGPAWKQMMIFYPNGELFKKVKPGGTEAKNGVTGIFSESAEPGFDQVPKAEFLSWFPVGDYTILGFKNGGGLLLSQATLTHHIPAKPELVSPASGATVPYNKGLKIKWKKVPDPKPPESVIIKYQVIVSKEVEPGELKREFVVDLLPTQTQVTVPPAFFEPQSEYKYEIIARETSGNQTIGERPFSTNDK